MNEKERKQKIFYHLKRKVFETQPNLVYKFNRMTLDEQRTEALRWLEVKCTEDPSIVCSLPCSLISKLGYEIIEFDKDPKILKLIKKVNGKLLVFLKTSRPVEKHV